MDSITRWRLAERRALMWREWDGEAVVRDDRTGDTHLLGPAPALAWRALAKAGRPLARDELIAAMVGLDTGVDSGSAEGDSIEWLEAMLADLVRLGLVEIVPR